MKKITIRFKAINVQLAFVERICFEWKQKEKVEKQTLKKKILLNLFTRIYFTFEHR